LTAQISSAYSRMVRSLENMPLPAVYRMELRSGRIRRRLALG
jgi:hypothetical protein